MPRYRLHYGSFEDFYAQGAGEVVPLLQERHVLGEMDEGEFMRRLAIEMCEWSGDNYHYGSRDALAGSMIRNGLLELMPETC